MMNIILTAAVAVAVIGLVCGVILAVASKVMAVEEDPRFPAIRAALPGANCGACGYAGCDGYAQALASGKETRPNICVPGGVSCAVEIASVLGSEAGEGEKRLAVVCCAGDCTKTDVRMNYQGVKSCAAARLLFGGPDACAFGCLGNGDCMAVCPNNAIRIEKGVAVVDRDLCTGCGLCANVCPNRVIGIFSAKQQVINVCSNLERGKAVVDVCKAGCMGCTKCTKVCPNNAIKMDNALARVNPLRCTACGKCVEACPTGSVKFVFGGPRPQPEPEETPVEEAPAV